MAEAAKPLPRGGALSFFGWRVVLALALMRLVGGGVGLYGRGVFLLPMEEDLGVGRDSISLVFALTGLQVGLFAPIAGILAQRYGGRRLLLIGSVSAGMPCLDRPVPRTGPPCKLQAALGRVEL